MQLWRAYGCDADGFAIHPPTDGGPAPDEDTAKLFLVLAYRDAGFPAPHQVYAVPWSYRREAE